MVRSAWPARGTPRESVSALLICCTCLASPTTVSLCREDSPQLAFLLPPSPQRPPPTTLRLLRSGLLSPRIPSPLDLLGPMPLVYPMDSWDTLLAGPSDATQRGPVPV